MSPKKENLLNDTYHKWMQTGLYDLPLDGINEFVDPEIMGYGTAIDEKVISLSEYRELINTQREQAVGLEMSIEITPVFRSISNKEDSAIFVDEIKVSINVNEDKQGLFLRITTILEYIDSKWIVVHWHGSIPTETTAETDAWLVNEWKRKNEELQKLVDEKTSELLNKNRELEIEAALEKVRSSALTMKQPSDMLDVCKVISDQLQLLGVNNIRNVQTAIINEQKGAYLNYQYFTAYDKSVIEEAEYNKHPKAREMAETMKRSANAFFSQSFDGEELNVFQQYRKQDNQFPDPILEESNSIHFYFYSIGPGALGISTYSSILSESDTGLFKRFRNVFELAYRRFTDIEKAEGQAKEAQIELALERVRARTMAMLSSNELKEVVLNMFDGLKSLGVDPTVCNISLIDKKTCDSDVWSAHQTDNSLITYRVFISHFKHPFRKKLIDSFLNKISFSVHELSGDLKKSYIQYLIEHVDYSKVPDEVTKSNEKLVNIEEGIVLSAAYMKYGLLIVSRNLAISNDESDILQRFAKIFEQTYTRFLDLQKAEAQARESQIELALERVRARTMAMQKSDELKEVIQLVYEQFVHLNILVEHAGFIMDYKARDDMHIWLADKHEVPSEITIPYFDSPHWNSFIEAKEKGMDFFANHLTFEEKNKFYKELFKLFPVSDDAKEYYSSCPGLAISTVLLENVGLYIENFSGIPYSDKENNTLMRFGKVFQQTYTRFLDLQKAEAQAREAQIELALERVRARTMAMQQSDELSETARVLFQQFKELGEDPDQLSIGIVNESEKVIEIWLSLQGNIMNRMFKAPIDEPTVINKIYTAWREKRKSVIIDISGDELERYNRYVNSDVDFKEYNAVKNITVRDEHRRIIYTALFSKGLLSVATQEPRSEETIKILERFAGVFDGTYTRFLDLQKAEAQAREAQIEAALERVRSRSLAMHKSDELNEVVSVLFEKLKDLKIPANAVGIAIPIDGSKDLDSYVCGENESGLNITNYCLPYFNNQIPKDLTNALEKQLEFFVGHYSKEEKDSFYNYVLEHTPEFKQLPEDIKRLIFDSPTYTISMVAVKNAVFNINDFEGKPLAENEIDIIKRFARVFDQAYTRFLDLQKAEAQTREAQIELSLERIRAQVTAMRESSELLDIVVTMRSEFVALGHEAHYFWHMRWLPDKYEKAMTSGDGARIGMVMTLPRHIHGDIKLVADWEKSDEPSVVLAMDVETAVNYVEKMITLGDFQQVDPQAPTLDDIRHIGGLTFIMARTTHGEIGFSLPGTVPNPPEESVTTLARFAGVFDLAYRRFEDLKEAEEKNKIIQADNERKTKELEDARQLQLSMLPKALPKLPHLDIAVYMKTATEVGGDYYDFNVDANGTLTVLVGDATGHGMMSGMMVSIMKSFFISNKANIELKQFFENSNNSIKDMQLGRLMMGLIGIQITTEKLIATNAGMPSLLYFRNKSQKAGEFVSNNLPLGGMKGTKYLLKAVRYEKGDTLLLMSDGFAELKNSQNEQYGYVRIKEIFRSLVHKSSSGIIEELKTAASQWTNGAEPDDDITFVVIKFK